MIEREVSQRVFAYELDQINLKYKKSEEQMAQNYFLLPTGVEINRVFMVGTLIECNPMGDSGKERYRCKLVDPSGTVTFNAMMQYNPDAYAALMEMSGEVPLYVAIVGKPDVFQDKEDQTKFYAGIKPEYIIRVDTAAANIWNAETLASTVARLEALKTPDETAQKALAHYNTDVAAYKEMLLKVYTAVEEWNASTAAFEDSLTAEVESADAPEATPAAEPAKKKKATAK